LLIGFGAGEEKQRHDTAPPWSITGGSATGLSATGAWAMPLPVMVRRPAWLRGC